MFGTLILSPSLSVSHLANLTVFLTLSAVLCAQNEKKNYTDSNFHFGKFNHIDFESLKVFRSVANKRIIKYRTIEQLHTVQLNMDEILLCLLANFIRFVQMCRMYD